MVTYYGNLEELTGSTPDVQGTLPNTVYATELLANVDERLWSKHAVALNLLTALALTGALDDPNVPKRTAMMTQSVSVYLATNASLRQAADLNIHVPHWYSSDVAGFIYYWLNKHPTWSTEAWPFIRRLDFPADALSASEISRQKKLAPLPKPPNSSGQQ